MTADPYGLWIGEGDPFGSGAVLRRRTLALTVAFAAALEESIEPVVSAPVSPPSPRQLVIVASREVRLYEHLRLAFARDPRTVVLLDRRRTAGTPPAGSVQRRKRVTFRRDLGLHFVIVVPEESTNERGEGQMNSGEVMVVDDRERVERWVEDSQYVIGRLIPGLLQDRDRWRTKAEAAEQEIDRLRSEVAAVRKEIAEREAERQLVRAEQAVIAEAFGRAMEHLTHMQQPLTDIVKRLQSLQPVLAEANGTNGY
jgi:hypothetical protein